MKKICLIISVLLITISLKSQTGFSPESFMEYRNSIKDMTLTELMTKYPPSTVYYSDRENQTDPMAFRYLDSIELRYLLTEDEKMMIADNHFTVTERLNRLSFADAIVDIYCSDLPFFLSTDLVLHALHTSYDKMLQNIEYQLLEGNLITLVSAMREQLPVLYSMNSSDPRIVQSIKDADLFLAVGISLLEGNEHLPLYDDSGLYSSIIDEIMKTNPGILKIGLFSEHLRNFDASQFVPRGHYAAEEYGFINLENYFRAMMWFGRVDFFLTPPPLGAGEPPWSEEDILRMNTGALIINELLDMSGEKKLLELHEKIIGFFVGPEDNLSPAELKSISTELELDYKNIQNPDDFADLQAKIKSSDDYGQKILSNFFYVDADKENPAELPVSYNLLGQKFLIDSYVFSQVVYDNIYYNDQEVLRMMPDPLDIMFVLGNDNALPLLNTQLESFHYSYKLEELRTLTGAYDQDFWKQSLYNNWLNAIRALNPPADNTGYPYFMKTTEWQVQKLNTQLASWTELRHDNVLYAKQSYTGGTSCSFPHVYVEPYPEFYSLLKDFSDAAASFFNEALNQLSPELKEGLIDYYEIFGSHMQKLELLAVKELRAETFNNEEISYLKTFVNSAMASGPYITGWYTDLFYDEMKAFEADFLVVDVHTQPTDESGAPVGKVLHVGTGHVNYGIFCTGTPFNNYEPTAFIGPVMSFHTKTTDNFERLTDKDWSDLVMEGQGLSGPAWQRQYLLDKNGIFKQPSVPGIPGLTYQGTGIEDYGRKGAISYMLAFPNPARESANLRFILAKTSDIELNLYDILGRRLYSRNLEKYPAGEHNLVVNLRNYNRGLYYVSLTADGDKRVIKLVIE